MTNNLFILNYILNKLSLAARMASLVVGILLWAGSAGAQSTDSVLGGQCDVPVRFHFSLLSTAGGATTYKAFLNTETIVLKTVLSSVGNGTSTAYQPELVVRRLKPGVHYLVNIAPDAGTQINTYLSMVAPVGYKVFTKRITPVSDSSFRSVPGLSINGNLIFQIQLRRDDTSGDAVMPFGEGTPLQVSDINWQLGLGVMENGFSAGRLQLCSDTVSTDLNLRRQLIYTMPIGADSQINAIRENTDGNIYTLDAIRQIAVPQGLVDLIDNPVRGGYDIKCYTSYTAEAGFYQPVESTLYVTYEVYTTDPGDGTLVFHLNKIHDGNTQSYQVAYNDSLDSYVLTRSGGEYATTTTLSNEIDKIVYRDEDLGLSYSEMPGDIPAVAAESFSSERRYQDFGADYGERVIRQSYDPADPHSYYDYAYHDNIGFSHNYAKLKYSKGPYGEWQYYLYNSVTSVTEFNGVAYDTIADNYYGFASLTPDTSDLAWILPHHGLPYARYHILDDSFSYTDSLDNQALLDVHANAGNLWVDRYFFYQDWDSFNPKLSAAVRYNSAYYKMPIHYDPYNYHNDLMVGELYPSREFYAYPTIGDRANGVGWCFTEDIKASPNRLSLFSVGSRVTKHIPSPFNGSVAENYAFKPITRADESRVTHVYGYLNDALYNGSSYGWVELSLSGVDLTPYSGVIFDRVDVNYGLIDSQYGTGLVIRPTFYMYVLAQPNAVVYLNHALSRETEWLTEFLNYVLHPHNGLTFTIDSFTPVAGESTKRLKAYNKKGELKREEFWILTTGMAWEEVETLIYDYNDHGRLTKITSQHDSHSKVLYEAQWNGLLKTWESDVTGIRTAYTYDGLERVHTVTQNGATGVTGIPASLRATTYYDALDRPVYTETGTGASKLVSTRKLDAEGKLLEETDTNNLTVHYNYEKDAQAGLRLTVTYPGQDAAQNNLEEVRLFHKNGRLKSVTGNTVVDQHFVYGYDATTFNTTVEVHTGKEPGSAGAHPVSRRTIDLMGRPASESWTTAAGQDFQRNYVYHPGIARLNYTAESQVAEGAQTGTPWLANVVEHSWLGQIKRSWIDVDSSGTQPVDASTDRMAGEESLYVKMPDGTIWLETTTTVYPQDNVATAFKAYTRSKLTGLDANTLSVTEVEDVAGNTTTTTVTVDRANAIVTTTVDYPDSDIDEVSVTQNGFLKSFTSAEGHTTTYGYDEIGRQILVTDARGISTVTRYEANRDRVAYLVSGITATVDGTEDIATLGALGYVTQYGYEADTGRLAWEKNPAGKTTYYSYNSRGQLEKQWGEAVYPVWYQYDDFGQLVKQHTYGMASVPPGTDFTTATWPAGAGEGTVTEFKYYDAAGLLHQRIDAAGTASERVTTYTYDQRGRLMTETSHDGGVDDPAITKTYVYHHKTDELLSITYSGDAGLTSDLAFTYHRSGDLASVTEGGATARVFTYDFGAVAGQHTDLQWLAEDLPDSYTALTGAAANDSGYHHDRLVNDYQDGTGGEVAGRLGGYRLGQGDAGSAGALAGSHYANTYGYDSQGRLNSVAPGQGGAWTYTYQPQTNLIEARTLADSTISEARSYEDDRTLLKSIETLADTGVSISRFAYRYDPLGNRTDAVQTGSQFGGYGAGLVVAYTYNDRQEVKGFDTYTGNDAAVLAGSPSRVPGRSFGFGYDAMGNRRSVTHKAVALDGGAAADRTFSWQADALNQLAWRENPSFAQVQGTAPANALVTAGLLPADLHRDLADLQRVGDYFNQPVVLRTSSPVVPGEASGDGYYTDELAVFSVVPQGWVAGDGMTVLGDLIDRETRALWLPPSGESFSYDARGNLKADGRRAYAWDGENRLVLVETGAAALAAGVPPHKIGYRYDYSGRRYAKDVYAWDEPAGAYEASPSRTTLYYYDGWNLVYEATFGGITYSGGVPVAATFERERAYFWGLDWSTTLDGAGGVGGLVALAVREAGEATPTLRYPGYDGNGNLVNLLDAAGNVTASYEYGPYGELWRASGPDADKNPFRFSTKYYDDETGHYYYGYRYYAPEYGRFLSQDPIGESGGLHLHAFVNNNPVNAWDYLGMINLNLRSGGYDEYDFSQITFTNQGSDPLINFNFNFSNGSDYGLGWSSGSGSFQASSFSADIAQFWQEGPYQNGPFYLGAGFGAVGDYLHDLPADTHPAAQWYSYFVGNMFHAASGVLTPQTYAEGSEAYGAELGQVYTVTDGDVGTTVSWGLTSWNMGKIIESVEGQNALSLERTRDFWVRLEQFNQGLLGLEAFLLPALSRYNTMRTQALPEGGASRIDVWAKSRLERGRYIEDTLAATDYKDFFRVGQLNEGKFPLVDFQKGNTLVSLKSVNPSNPSAISRMKAHIEALSGRGFVDGQPANMILDIRVPQGQQSALGELVEFGRSNGVNVIIKGF